MIAIAAWTHVGLVRERNEDAVALPGILLLGSPATPAATVLSPPEPGEGAHTIAVVDGMGGHAGGAEASRLAALRLTGTRGEIEEALTGINAALYEEMERHPDLRAMGATVAGVQIAAGSVEVFNVGDARAYTHIGGYTTVTSVDDRSETGSGEITQSLGGTPEPTRFLVHRHSISLDDLPLRLMLCSDGLSEYVSFNAIQDTLDIVDAVEAVGRLVALALEVGAPDNVSVAIVDFGDLRHGFA